MPQNGDPGREVGGRRWDRTQAGPDGQHHWPAESGPGRDEYEAGIEADLSARALRLFLGRRGRFSPRTDHDKQVFHDHRR